MAIEELPVVRQTLLPKEMYEHDTGSLLYAVMLPFELPYKALNKASDMYYHITATKHIHE